MVDRLLRAGVAGAGAFGAHHAAKFSAAKDVRLCATYDIDPEPANRLAQKHGCAAFHEFDAFLAAVDILTVAAPASAHYQLAHRALAAGKHVLVEKPITLRVEHADDLIEAAKRRRLVLQVGHQERFVLEALGVTKRRKPSQVRARRLNPASMRGRDVSVVLDLMVHDIDLVRSLGFEQCTRVEASGDFDSVTAALWFADGSSVVLDADRAADVRDRRMTLVYEDGEIEIDFQRRQMAGSTAFFRNGLFADNNPALVDPLGYGVERFIEAVRNGEAAPIEGAHGRAALEWALMIDECVAASSLRSVTVA